MESFLKILKSGRTWFIASVLLLLGNCIAVVSSPATWWLWTIGFVLVGKFAHSIYEIYSWRVDIKRLLGKKKKEENKGPNQRNERRKRR